jgi:hypothetical protein
MEFEEKYAGTLDHPVKLSTLKKLCLISIFFSGAMTLFSFGGLFISGWMANYINFYIKGFYNVGGSVFFLFFLGTFVLFGSSLTAAILMLRSKRIGYWFYMISNAIMIILSFFVVMNFINILFIAGSITFMVLYTIKIKQMK